MGAATSAVCNAFFHFTRIAFTGFDDESDTETSVRFYEARSSLLMSQLLALDYQNWSVLSSLTVMHSMTYATYEKILLPELEKR
jgi:hypothetical protein